MDGEKVLWGIIGALVIIGIIVSIFSSVVTDISLLDMIFSF